MLHINTNCAFLYGIAQYTFLVMVPSLFYPYLATSSPVAYLLTYNRLRGQTLLVKQKCGIAS